MLLLVCILACILLYLCCLKLISYQFCTYRIFHGSCRVNQSLQGKAPKLTYPHIGSLNRKQATLIRCCCLSLLNADRAIISEWVPVVDQVLLLASITLTYMAGVIPAGKSLYSVKTSISAVDVVPENSSSSGR